MLPFYGKPSNLESYPTTPKNYFRGTASLARVRRGRKADRDCRLTHSKDPDDIGCKSLPRREKKIRVNVCGRMYEIALQQLEKFPKSLLADPKKRKLYHDTENDEIFFDRNRTTFESIYYFYVTSGMLVFPTKTFSLQILADELFFFGLYNYLSPEEKQHGLPTPSMLQSSDKVISPKAIWQKKFWEICEFPESSYIARIATLSSLLVILFAVVILCIETLPSVRNSNPGPDIMDTRVNYSISTNQNITKVPNYNNGSYTVKYFISRAKEFCIAWFTLELVIRFAVSPEKRRFLLKFLNIVDIAAILPFYISLMVSTSSVAPPVYLIKVFHLSKIFRVLKVSRYTSTMKIISKTAKACLSDLWTMVFLTFMGTVLFGIVVYYCELWDQGTEFRSIPDSFWWAVVTITTVGYGDMVPNTLAGKILGGACTVSGVIFITPLLPIIFNKFNRLQKLEDSKPLCQCRPSEPVK